MFLILSDECKAIQYTTDLLKNKIYLVRLHIETGFDQRVQQYYNVIINNLNKLGYITICDNVHANPNFSKPMPKVLNLMIIAKDFEKRLFKRGYREYPHPELDELNINDPFKTANNANSTFQSHWNSNLVDEISFSIETRMTAYKEWDNIDLIKAFVSNNDLYILLNKDFMDKNIVYYLDYHDGYDSIYLNRYNIEIYDDDYVNVGQGFAIKTVIYSAYKNLSANEIAEVFDNMINFIRNPKNYLV